MKCAWVFAVLFLSLSCLAQLSKVKSSSTAQLIQLPQLTPSVVFPGEQATVLTPANGAALTTALTGVACGTTIRLTHGVTYSTSTAFPVTTNCTCRNASNVYNNSQWIIIESDSYIGGSVRGNRIDPSTELANLPALRSTDTNYLFQATNNSAGCYWLLGLDMNQNAGNFQTVVAWGDQSSLNYPHDLVIDHSYVHGLATEPLIRCILFNGIWQAAVDSYISDCHKVGQDTQAIEGWDGYGPILIQNCFLEAAGENFMEGGAAPQTVGTVPADITIKGNEFFKPLAWRKADPTYNGTNFSVKNLLENKNAQRELITGNYFLNTWSDSQSTGAFLFDIESTGGADPAAAIEDVNFNFNVLQNSERVALLATSDSNSRNINQPDHRIYFHDNLYYNIDGCLWGNCGSNQNFSLGCTPPTAPFAGFDLWFVHETIASANTAENTIWQCGGGGPSGFTYGIRFKDSIIDTGAFGGFFTSGFGAGNAVITNSAPDAKLDHNCAYGSGGGIGNLSNFASTQTPANQAAVFVNPGTDFHVSVSSVCHLAASDGLDMGANINAVNAATAGVVKTLSNLHTVTNVSPSTFTHSGGTGLTITGTNFQSGAAEVIIGGAGPSAAVSTVTCSVNTCTVVMTGTISLQVNDTVNIGSVNGYVEANGENHLHTVASVTDNQHFTYTSTGIGTQSWTGGNANRVTPGNLCTSPTVTANSITCTTPAASGAVTTGPVSVFVSQFGIPVQSTVFGNYN
jgi:hypothetical protein